MARNSSNRDRIMATMVVNNCDVKFQLDTAADVNIICKQHVRKSQVMKSTQTLHMWNNESTKPAGEAELEVLNPKTETKHKVRFTVVDNGHTNLIGLSTIKKLNWITINQ
jgi:hypothetical protein